MPYQTFIKDYNERRVLTLLRLEGPHSRTEIARRVVLPKSSISQMMERLIGRGLVTETADQSRRQQGAGRPGIRVALNPGGAFFLGAEVGVHSLRLALVDLGLNVVETQVIHFDAPPSAPQVVEELRTYIGTLSEQPERRQRLAGIGVSVPGLVRADGFVLNLLLVGWQDVNFIELAEEVLGTELPILIQNDANAAALGQVYLSPALADDVFLSLRIEEGCGGAAIVNGRLFGGGTGLASEFGHMRVSGTGPLCSCGRQGCLEPFVNLEALASALHQTGQRPSPSEVAKAARAGDVRALAAVRHLTRHLQLGLTSLTNIFNPNEIILGGAMAPIYAVLLDELTQGVAQEIVPGMPVPRLLITALGEYECAIGAAAVVHQSVFETVGMPENLGR